MMKLQNEYQMFYDYKKSHCLGNKMNALEHAHRIFKEIGSFRITNKKLDVRKNGWHFTVNCDFNIDQVPKEAKGYMYEKK